MNLKAGIILLGCISTGGVLAEDPDPAGGLRQLGSKSKTKDALLIADLKSRVKSLTGTVSELTATVTTLQAETSELNATVVSLQAGSAGLYTDAQVQKKIYDTLVVELAYGDFDKVTPSEYKTVARLSNSGFAGRYDAAGALIANKYNPEPGFYLSNAGDDSLLRDMQGDGFKFPTKSNEPSDVAFTLPEPPAYSTPSDLYYKTILELAALIKSKTVSCVTVIQAFIDRLDEFDRYLGLVATPLYDRAIATAAAYDTDIANGIYIGPLMCIPFGVKDHHQIFDDEPTMYGHVLYANNVQNQKSSLMAQLMKSGAIPIAKTMLGTFASGSANGWGECMSPYLNGGGCGSSCGSGGGASLGAFPFAISEETSGSIACPSSASLISGHIGSFGSFSRTGAGLLCSETDHLGFHSRYLSDFGVIFNYARTGKDPLDGDTVAQDFVNPADVDLTELKVMIIDGKGEWVLNTTSGSWYWNEVVSQSYSKTAWHWPERVAKIKEKLDAAGVSYDVFSKVDANKLWSFNKTTPFWSCASPDINTMKGGGPWAQTQEFELAVQNSKWKGGSWPKNIPVKSYRYLKYCMVEIGKKMLNDKVWKTYDVIIDSSSTATGAYDLPGGNFEQWVRTAKTFVMDYYQPVPCATTQGDTIEGAYAVLTAKPFEDYKNFAIGALIQDTSAIIFPNDDAIKTAHTNRTRCPYSFYATFKNMTDPAVCPPLNGPDGPPSPTLRGIDAACVKGGASQHLPDGWANELYVPPYELAEKVPDRAIWAWDKFSPVACTAVCPFLPSFCELKGITCTARRLAEEAAYEAPKGSNAPVLTKEDYKRLSEEFEAMHSAGNGEL